MKEIVSNLNGYLKSISRLSGESKCYYWAQLIDNCTAPESSIHSYIDGIGDYKPVVESLDYAAIELLLQEYLIDVLPEVSKKISSLFVWDIVEYFGLAAYSAAGKDAQWNPLVNHGATVLIIHSDKYKKEKRLLVKVEDRVIVFGLAINRI